MSDLARSPSVRKDAISRITVVEETMKNGILT